MLGFNQHIYIYNGKVCVFIYSSNYTAIYQVRITNYLLSLPVLHGLRKHFLGYLPIQSCVCALHKNGKNLIYFATEYMNYLFKSISIVVLSRMDLNVANFFLTVSWDIYVILSLCFALRKNLQLEK